MSLQITSQKSVDQFMALSRLIFCQYSTVFYFDQTAHPPVLVEWFSRLLDLIVHPSQKLLSVLKRVI